MTAAWQSEAHNGDVNGNNIVVNKPSGTVDGDLLLAVGISTIGGVSAPAGWTTDPASLGTTGPLWSKIASGEPSTYSFDLGGTALGDVVICRISGQASSWRDDADGVSATGNLVIPSVDSGGADRLLMQIVLKRSGVAISFTGPGSQTERFDVNAGQSQDRTAGGDEIVGSGATGTRTWVPSSGSLAAIAYQVAIAPAPPTEGTFTGSYGFAGSGFTGQAGPGEGTLSGAYAFTGSGFDGQAGPGEGVFAGGYDFEGSSFVGVAGDPSSFGFFNGMYDYTGTFTGSAVGDDLFDVPATEGGRRRWGGRK